jgi:aspartate racemase
MKKIGLVGGLGWVSTQEYYRLVNTITNQKLGGHRSAHVLIESLDEGAFLESQSKDPTEKMCEAMIVDAVSVLVSGGAEIVALCANGLHRFMPALESQFNVEFVDIRKATALSIQQMGLHSIGLLGVQKTMESDFYTSVLSDYRIDTLIPTSESRVFVHDKIISELVLNCFVDETKQRFLSIVEELIGEGAQGIILGCTEIPLLLISAEHKGIPLFSTTEIHCREIVNRALV